MDARLSYRPTLVVGVGGTGCEIAERVRDAARAGGLDRRGRIAVMGFDTDINDIQTRTGIDPRNMVQTSSLDTVYQILEKNPEAEGPAGFSLTRAALPNRYLNMKLIEGAAQVRMLSHLALYDQLKRRRVEMFAAIGQVMAGLARHDARTEFTGALSIILCGSLAGATGSGMAVQTALLLRRIALDRGIRGVSVRGLFLLPDVFVQAASLGAQQIDNVLANGYASLKELAAVIARADDQPQARAFDFAYGPDMWLKSAELPFEAVTLIDFESASGGNLGANIANYKQLAARAVYLQTFTALGRETLSRTINDALAGVDASARGASNLYSGVGIAAVNYPAQTVADYLGHRFAQEVLSGDWLRLDRLFRDEVRRYEELKAAGNLAVRTPDIAVSYLETLDQFARRDRIAFFMEIGERLNPVLVDPETREERRAPLSGQYLDALLAHMSQTFWSAPRLAEIRARGALDPGALALRERIESAVRQAESLLDADFQAVETAVSEQPDRLFNNMITVEDDRAAAELQPYNLQFYTVRGGPHPVQVRAFLYETIAEARRRRDAIDLERTRRAVLAAAEVFLDSRDPTERDPERRGTAAVFDAARAAARPGLLGRMAGTTRGFVETYVRYYDDTVQRVRDHGQRALERRVLDALLSELVAVVAAYEGLFAEIGRSLAAIDQEVARLELRHASDGSFDGNLYVYSNRAAKQAAWEELKLRTVALRQAENVNAALNAALYRKHRSDRMARRPTAFAEVRALFDAEVVQRFAMGAVSGDHRAVWDLSVIEAVRKEAELTGESWTERLQRAVDLVKVQAEPFLRFQDPSDGQVMVFWAMPPSIREDYGDSAGFDRLFTSQQGEKPLEAPDFSRHELLCVNSRVNLELTHLAKLDPGTGRGNANEPATGRYYRAYAQRVSRLIDEEMALRGVAVTSRSTSVITPHIHRDWHRASRLPEIFPEARARVDLDMRRAVLVSFGLGLLQKETDYGRSITYFSTVGRLAALSIREKLVESHDVWRIAGEFRDRADLVRAANGVWAAEKAALRPGGRFAENNAVIAAAGAGAVLRILELAAPRDSAKAEREAEALGLFAAREAVLDELAAVLLPHLDVAGRHDTIRAFADRSADEAFAAFAAFEGIQKPTVDQLRAIHEAGARLGRVPAGA